MALSLWRFKEQIHYIPKKIKQLKEETKTYINMSIYIFCCLNIVAVRCCISDNI